jgi:hypothetical protein
MADEGFLHRWSRRKAEARTTLEAPEPAQDGAPERAQVPPPAAPQVPAGSTGARAAEDAEGAIDLEALPDVETLTYDSDFTPFMRKGVPPELRKRALQRLWRSNPTLANLDGLVEYGGDYTKIGTTKQVVRTAYQVGRGMLERIEKAAGEPAPPGAPLTADTGQPATTPEPAAADAAASGPDRIAAPAADEAVSATTARPEDTPRAEEERQAEQSRPARTPRPLPRRG